jgi:DNA-binding Lrp family transcriptional regulator
MRDLKLIPEVARQLPQVTECYRITGEDCYFFKLYLRSIEELEPILDRFTPLGRTTTSIVNAIPVPRRPLPVTETEPRLVAVSTNANHRAERAWEQAPPVCHPRCNSTRAPDIDGDQISWQT